MEINRFSSMSLGGAPGADRWSSNIEPGGAVVRDTFVDEAAVLSSPEHADRPVYVAGERAEADLGMGHDMGIGKQPMGCPVFFLGAQMVKNNLFTDLFPVRLAGRIFKNRT